MAHIFISYSHQDIKFARYLRNLLEDKKFPAWIDETRPAASRNRWPLIEENIKSCDVFIVIMSPQHKNSAWANQEILLAKKYQKPIIPMLYTGEPWPQFSEYEDMRAGTKAHLSSKLIERLHNLVTISGSRKAPPQLDGELLPDKSKIIENHTKLPQLNRSEDTQSHKNSQKRLNEPWAIVIAAVITGIFVLIGALIQRENTGTSTPTPDLTAIYNSNQTTQVALALLQLTSDIQAAETALLTTNTQIATQTQSTTAAPTIDTPPTETAPPTSTSVPPTPFSAPSNTPAPPNGGPISLTIYRDEDSFTLYVPQVDSEMSLVGLEYRVQRTDGSTILRQLDRDYAAFLGMPFLNIYSLRRSICFRLVRDGSNVPAPQDCQTALLLTQHVADADVFWYDSSANVAYSVQIIRDGNLVSLCPAGRAQCDIEWWIS